MMVALVHHSPDGKGVHETEAWVFLSPEKQHDVDFHHYALQMMLEHYLKGEGASATRRQANTEGEQARCDSSSRWPNLGRVILFTDGCAKQYKGKRNFRLISLNPHKLGVVIDHNFAATSHFKGTHDGIGGVAKNMMRKAELYGNHRITDSKAAHAFLKKKFDEKVKDSETYFSAWSPYKIKRTRVKFLPLRSIPRPFVDLEGIKGTLSNYQFTGDFEMQPAREPLELADASTMTDGPETEHFVVRSTEPFKGKRALHAKTKTSISVGVRKASCFCSSCKDQIWHACRVAVKFPDLVSNMREEKLGVVKSTYSFGTQSD
ncbi:unnamed protein product [Ascophyllum nodosum]